MSNFMDPLPGSGNGLKAFLDERLVEVPKPFAVKALDKQVLLDGEKVADTASLIPAIQNRSWGPASDCCSLNWKSAFTSGGEYGVRVFVAGCS